MTFECNGVRYDSDQLYVYETGDAYVPLVYMTRDEACVFVLEVHRWEGAVVRQLANAEIAEVAGRFGIEEIRRAIRQGGNKGK
jgi:hypothetical protein